LGLSGFSAAAAVSRSTHSEFSPADFIRGRRFYFLDQDPSVAARAFAEIASKSLPDGAAPLSGQAGISWMESGAMVWLAGAAAFFSVSSYCTGVDAAGTAPMERSWYRNPAAVALFEQSKQELSVTKPIRLCACMRVASPMCGLFSPTVLLPHADMQAEQLTSIFRSN
jgi:hypothetical protein